MVRNSWIFFILFQVITANILCSEPNTCEACVSTTISGTSVCVWCRSNSTCKGALDTCPKDATDPEESILVAKKCKPVSKDALQDFIYICSAFGSILLFFCILGYILTHRKKKEKQIKYSLKKQQRTESRLTQLEKKKKKKT